LACADCPEKDALLERLSDLNPDGPTYVKLEPPVEHEYTEEELNAEKELDQIVETVTEVVEDEGGRVEDSHIVWTDEDRNPSQPEEERKE
jgi:hypothetical protein